MFSKWKALFRKGGQRSSEPPAREEPAKPAPKGQGGRKKLSDEEKLIRLTDASLDYLREHGQEESCSISFEVPGKEQEAYLMVSKRTRGGRDSWLFSAGVARIGSDRLHSHYLCSGEGREGKDKVLACLARPELTAEVIASIEELSSHVDRDG